MQQDRFGRMADVTFRDFAGALMGGDRAKAASVLEALLGVSPETATAASGYFEKQMKDPAFMPKAMGLRTAVTTGTDAEVGVLIEQCFGLRGPALAGAVAALRGRYPRS
jgi:hypothetical protein